jgi:hypothetical protein
MDGRPVFRRPAASGVVPMSLETDLLAIDEQFWTGGPEAYEQHCDDRCLVVFAGMAAVMPRDEIAKTAEKGRWTDVKLAPKGFVQLSDTSAVIAYDCTARRKDGQPHHALVSSSYVHRPAGWKLAAHQQTEVVDRTA